MFQGALMSQNPSASLISDPTFQGAMRHLHVGEWDEGLQKLNQLFEPFPQSQELHDLVTEMELRARIDQDEIKDRTLAKQQLIKKWAVRLVMLLAIFALGLWGMRAYSGWIQQRWSFARQEVENEVQRVKIETKFQDGQNLLLAGRTDMAEALFLEIAAVEPNYPGLDIAINQVNNLKGLEAKYAQAMSFVAEENFTSAQTLLREIQAQQAYFKNVSTQIEDLERQIYLSDMFSNAEASFQARKWVQAVTGYETVRVTDPSYKTESVEQSLFTAYMNAGLEVLDSDTATLEDLGIAEDYFRRAFALRPQDPVLQKERSEAQERFGVSLSASYISAAQALLQKQADNLQALQTAEDYLQKVLEIQPNDLNSRAQLEMVRHYLQAQENFRQGFWDQAIEALQYVYDQDPEYAAGTSRQTLYEAFIARGQDRLVGNEYEKALEDFKQAAAIAEEIGTPFLGIYDTQIMIAEAQGLLGNHKEAVLLYQNLLEAMNLSDDTPEYNPDLQVKLKQARDYTTSKEYKMAFDLYREITPLVLIASTSGVDYVVQAGDYLPMLANRYNTTIAAIARANNLNPLDPIQVGDKLFIPSGNP
jgi:LysM repeat protein